MNKNIGSEKGWSLPKLKIFSVLINLSVFLILLNGCTAKESAGQGNNDVTIKTIKVSAIPVRRASLSDSLTIYGKVVFSQETFVASQFNGRLDMFSLLIGDRVKKGQQIGMIVPPAREALLQIGDSATSDVRLLADVQIKSMALFSPISGVVLKVYQHSGDVVQAGQQIVHIGDDHALEIQADLPLRYQNAIRTGNRIRADFINSGLSAQNLVLSAIGGQIDMEKQTVVLRVQLPNINTIYHPGMLAKLAIPLHVHQNTLIVPRIAIQESEGNYYLFVVQGDTVQRRTIIPGIMKGNEVEIIAGVSENEVVVTDKGYSLQDGMEVTTI